MRRTIFMKITIILPTFREIENLPTLIPAILEAAPVDILVVDDGSDDGTREEVRRWQASTSRVSLLAREKKTGLGDAYRAGMNHACAAGADVVGTMDADWSHDPTRLPDMIAALDAGADVVIGSRYIPGGGIGQWPWWRRLLSGGAKMAARLVLGTICHDFTSGYRLYRRNVLETIPPNSVCSNSYSFLLEYVTLIARKGFQVMEVPIHFVDRRGGKSKMPTLEILRAINTLVRLKCGPLFGNR
jgi:dolichol-phosphate mannosyltransferase